MAELSDNQAGAIKKMISTGMSHAAGILYPLIRRNVNLSLPYLNLLSHGELEKKLIISKAGTYSSINLSFQGGLNGLATLIFTTDGASKLVSVFAGEEIIDDDLDGIRTATLSEIGNIVLNSLIGTISNHLRLQLVYSTPLYKEGDISSIICIGNEEVKSLFLLARTKIEIDDLKVNGDFVLNLELGSVNTLLQKLNTYIIEEA